jgi:iron complex outermembrane receptor protein
LPAIRGRPTSATSPCPEISTWFFDIANNPNTDEDSSAVYNASLGWESDDGQFEVVGWVRNLTDEEYRTYAIPVTSLGFTQNMYGKPRWYGVTFTMKLNGK